MARKSYRIVAMGGIGRARTCGLPVTECGESPAEIAAAVASCPEDYAIALPRWSGMDIAATVADCDAKGGFPMAVPAAVEVYSARAGAVFAAIGQIPPDCRRLAAVARGCADAGCVLRTSFVRMVGLPDAPAPLATLESMARRDLAVSAIPGFPCFREPPAATPGLRLDDLPVPHGGAELLDDTVAVVVHWGRGSALRNAATRRSLEWIRRWQRHLPRILFVELQTDGGGPEFADLASPPHVEHVFLKRPAEYGDLFQKEALYNYAMRLRRDAPPAAWIFQDSDILPLSPDYYLRYRAAILANPRHLVQGYDTWRDARCGGWQTSLGAIASEPGRWQGLQPAPGLVWGLSGTYAAECAEACPGRGLFNARCFSGSGDCTLIFEHLRPSVYGNWYSRHFAFDWFAKVVDLEAFPKIGVSCVAEHLGHVHHGPFADRAYKWSRKFLDAFGDLDAWCSLDADGLLRWRHADNVVRRIVRRKPDLKDRESVIRVACEEIAALMPSDDVKADAAKAARARNAKTPAPVYSRGSRKRSAT